MSEGIDSEERGQESLVAAAADEFMEQLRLGQEPSIDEFARRYPEAAGVIRQVLPALAAMRRSSSAAAVAGLSPEHGPDQPGMLGDFCLVREVGRGGMGIVYEAVQISLGRKVALKVLPFAAALDPRQLQRFKTEALAAAHLRHPHIVPIFAVGCERGVHYYAMQFIEGQSLDIVIAELRSSQAPQNNPGKEKDTSPPDGDYRPDPPTVPQGCGIDVPALAAAPTRPQVSPRTTLHSLADPEFFRTTARLALEAALALEHAHQFGIVHRDIKPGNLMVDAAGHLSVTDFGLARCKDQAGLTLTGDLVGTLRYMSPEQALGRNAEIDQRTDIYSLGATLYEMLTLQPVFDGTDRQEILRRITADQPSPPRRLCKAIPRELETIVLKCLEKHREDRYPTAQHLADDLRRFLEDRPILARKPGLLEKTARWSRGHRGAVAGAVALLIAAVVGLAASTVLIGREQARTQAAYELLAEEQQRTREEQERTRRAYEGEAKQRLRAEENFRRARQAVDFFTQVGEAELRDKPEVRRKFLEAALQYYQAFIEQYRADPSIRAELEANHLRVARILTEIGTPADVQAATRFLQGGASLKLLGNESVQTDLKLSADQVKQIDELNERRWAELFSDQRGWTPDDWAARAQKLAGHDQLALALLSPGQLRRLEQISLQLRGTQAFAEPEIVKTLQLTAEQQAQIAAILDQAARNFWGFTGPANRADWNAYRFGWGGSRTSRLEPWRKTEESSKLHEQALDLLTDEQKARWQELTGEPFRGEVRPTLLPLGGWSVPWRSRNP